MIIDNSSEEQALWKVIKDNLTESKEIKIASGYFYLKGFDIIKADLPVDLSENAFKIIIGTELDLPTKKEISLGYDLRKEIANSILDELDSIEAEDDIKRIMELHDLIKNRILEIKVFTKDKLHAKLYLFIERPDLIKKWYESKLISRNPGAAIVGSSNFTKRGLVSNMELNVSITDARTICELDEWFDRIWKDSEDFRDGLIKIINISDIENKKRTPLGICISPFELFKVFAYELLDGRIELTKERQVLVLFQEIGVINVIKKMKKYYGALISDSVGLGKSFIGSQIIKDYFYNRIDFWDKNLNF